MSDCTKNKNPLVRNGQSREQRLAMAPDAAFVVPDENKFEHWLVYARNLAGHVRYYDRNNQYTGQNWQPFFDADVSAQLALIAVQDVIQYKDKVRALLTSILSPDLKNDPEQLRKNFGLLFSGVFNLAYRINYFYKVLPDDVPLKRALNNLALTRLGAVLKRMIGYYKATTDFYNPAPETPIVKDDETPWTILAYKQTKLSEIVPLLKSDMGTSWMYKPAAGITTFVDYYDDIAADKTIYNHPAAVIADSDLWEVLNHAANHNLFTSVFAEFLTAYARIVQDAQAQLTKTITDQNTHEPHYALYLVFLQLLKIAQADLNGYTRKHLEFYYKDVLHLYQRKSEANHAHLLIELAKQVNELAIPKGTAFKAGKDSLGKEVLYTSDSEVIINKASVAELRSFYRAMPLDKIGAVSQAGLLYASPAAASGDGMGGKFTTETNDWHPFANKLFEDGSLVSINMPGANIGFALASHYLFLKEGVRSIVVTLTGTGLNNLSTEQFSCTITTEKNWLEKALVVNASATTATFTVNIDTADAPITAYNAKVHGETYGSIDTPVIRFILKRTAGNDRYEKLKEVALSRADIKVTVGGISNFNTEGMKELLVSSDTGVIDPSKPFIPFGTQPKAGAGLVIGNKEVFSKKGARLKLSISWAELDTNIQDMDFNLTDIFFPTAQVKFLRSGVWKDAPFTQVLNGEHVGAPRNGEVELFWAKSSVMIPDVYVPTQAATIPDDATVDYKDAYNPYNTTSKGGFVKLQLNQSFQFDAYFTALQLYLIKVANKTITNPFDPQNPEAGGIAPPVEPYVPKIQSMYLSYEATTSVTFSSIQPNTLQYLHLYPFGHDVMDAGNVVSGRVRLMPQFKHVEGGTDAHHTAEFYIGLKDAVPAQKVQILFKTVEGSTDPLRSKPESHVYWSYLSNNIWVDYNTSEISDFTRQLIETGIVTFPLPDAATNANTLLPAGLHWIKASIRELPEQVCRLIDVKAQAIQVTYSDQGNAADFLQKQLPANTISKLHTPDARVKKVEQPYTSFGGRYLEDERSYYTRVSERLRHKDRAITIRDFEQLILEAFPDIHKVKCLNHTRLELLANAVKYNEQAAGHVTIITIPDLRQKNAINPLRPYTSRNKLEEIKTFLRLRANCNMTLYVENPAFEEVRIETDVVLRKEAAGNDAYYRELLKQDLVAFLTPWAYNVNTDISFGGRITKSVLINFIEERPYIDFITDLKMFHNKMDGTPESGDQEEIMASTGRSILVSAPAKKHNVDILPQPVIADTSECE